MKHVSTLICCTLAAAAVGACASSDRTSGSLATSSTAKTSVSAVPDEVSTPSGLSGGRLGGGGQPEMSTANRSSK